ncbi:hypothetical protein ACFL6W_08305 [Thermodesulfobacteriota bacterium]
MDLFTMIVIIVAIGAFNKTYRYRMTTGAYKSKKTIDYLRKHIERLEDRVANVETIVIDKEKEKQFEEL